MTMYCVYCREEICEDCSRVVDKYENSYHIICYLEMLGIYLDMIDEQLLKEKDKLF